jgi:hypothetical protein
MLRDGVQWTILTLLVHSGNRVNPIATDAIVRPLVPAGRTCVRKS